MLAWATSKVADLVSRFVRPRIYPMIRFQARYVATGIELDGVAELPDGTILRYEVQARGPRGIPHESRRGTVRVSGGRFSITFEPSPWRERRLDVVVSIRADPQQPSDTQRLLGDRGQHMASDVNTKYGEFFVTAPVDIGDQSENA